ncbi:hypothetical protein WOLCODRAFT_80926 [Wolfiporia cocos MD-104 SS10]|uniref:UbiA prenyltransferase n=1 Tax=Wolfiporia cocos (strain MD-104) TaxID=742152 RepID=A0A2H3IZR6_WOLCO|nr:hypothetical protein WOLCODRAFT_80926 [Wolfiporia cocos MD-104 SS10]
MLTVVTQTFYGVLYHLYTPFLFTKSDIKTTLVPVTFFALAASHRVAVEHIPHAILWLWLHLLHFNVANQAARPEEDQHNKAWRPIPSGRMTSKNAMILRWLLVPVYWAISWLYGYQTLAVSIAFVALTVAYNELSIDGGHWIGRNVLNALGTAAFEIGTTLLTCNSAALDKVGTRSILISAGVIATTIHAQDFQDVPGDKKVGRRTLPIVNPTSARLSIPIGLICWTAVAVSIWGVDWFTVMSLAAMAVFIGWRYVFLTTIRDDEVSYIWYNVWMSCVHALPAYYRIAQRSVTVL